VRDGHRWRSGRTSSAKQCWRRDYYADRSNGSGSKPTDFEATQLKGRLLVVDDERGIVIALKGLFTKEGYEVETAESGEEALEKVKAGLFHVIITDLSMKGMSGLELLKHVRELDPACAVLMITAFGTQRIAVEAMKAGAEDYLPKPFDNDELRMKVRKVMETQLLKREHNQLLEQVRLETGVFENMVGRSRAMMRVFETIDKVAPTDVTVLIRGESGTGKELVARAIHFRSPRARKPFIAVNCAAFSRELVESELFGHEKGAFTGAVPADRPLRGRARRHRLPRRDRRARTAPSCAPRRR
jgi:DNA-binding NtrC family response regulator